VRNRHEDIAASGAVSVPSVTEFRHRISVTEFPMYATTRFSRSELMCVASHMLKCPGCGEVFEEMGRKEASEQS
jgi:hypothetical protein